MSNARDQLIDQMRGILRGEAATEPLEDDLGIVSRWFESSLLRWRELVETTPVGSSIRLPNGYFAASYRLAGNLKHLSLPDLLEALRRATVRHTGWPEFSVLTRPEIAPYIHDGVIECWFARDGQDHGAAHNDFWRASPEGNFFIIRGHLEDEPRFDPPKTKFDITLPHVESWRVAPSRRKHCPRVGRCECHCIGRMDRPRRSKHHELRASQNNIRRCTPCAPKHIQGEPDSASGPG